MTAAVVLGGGFAGVLAAAVLARHVDDVTLIEAGRYPDGPVERGGVPQAHHNHVLATGGARALEALLPGTVAELLARGAHRRDLTGEALLRSADGWFRRHVTGADVISCSRWLTDHVVRCRALAGGAVTVLEGTRVRALTGDASRVTGVVVERPGGRTATIPAEAVVDATGRRSRSPRWLAALGVAPAEEETIDAGLAYATRVYRAPAELAATIPAVLLHPSPEPGRPGHGATLFPIEDDRWIVTLTGSRGAAPPVHEQNFNDCAYALPSPVVAELMAAAKPLGGVRPFRATANRRRYVERGPVPAGFLVLGDALVALNPIYSHGMSVAALGALRLDRELARHGAAPAAFPRMQAAVAAEAEPAWRMATAGDRPADATASAFALRARERAGRATPQSPLLMSRMFRAQMLIEQDPSPAPPPERQPEPLGTDDAIGQYSGLADWWLSGRRPT